MTDTFRARAINGISRRRFLSQAVLWCAILAASCFVPFTNILAQEAASGGGDQIAVMTFNLRFASQTGSNAWPLRRPIMRDCIQQSNPDIIGTQEGVYYQLKDIARDLPQYDWIGTGRDGGSRGEFMAVYYKKDRFDPVEFDHFWLSDTPEVIASTSWGNSNRRMVTWILFEDKRTAKQFYLFNTHFDHQIQTAREKSAQLVRERISALKTDLPLLLIGDFNAKAGANKTYDILLEGGFLQDTWNEAAEKRGEIVYTFHGFRGPTKGDNRIDWILRRGPVTTIATEILQCHKDGQYPSDHFPVIAWVKLGP